MYSVFFSMEVTLTAYSGGQRKILLPDGNLRTENIIGTEYKKQVKVANRYV